jgi:hypothetical protein
MHIHCGERRIWVKWFSLFKNSSYFNWSKMELNALFLIINKWLVLTYNFALNKLTIL